MNTINMNTQKYLGKYATFKIEVGDKTLIREHKGCYKIVGTLKLENEEEYIDRSIYFNIIGEKSNDLYTDYYLLEYFSGYPVLSDLPTIMTEKYLITNASLIY